MVDDWMSVCSIDVIIVIGENRSTRQETCSSATQFTTNPTRTGLGSSEGLCGGMPQEEIFASIFMEFQAEYPKYLPIYTT
jgi:hypothetical protein